jgi:proteic killer suppression protein
VIRSFANQATEDLFNGRNTSSARRACPIRLWSIVQRKLDQLDSAVLLSELRVPPGNNLEALHGNRKGQYSIRINERYRICFRWLQNEADSVEVVDYHH